MSGTEHMTVDQYRREMGLDKPAGKAPAAAKQLRCPACDRREAFLRLVRQLLDLGYTIRLEHKFHPDRRWRFDLALLDSKVALEIDGFGKAHYGIPGRQNDNEKSAEAQLLGWQVYRVGWEHVQSGEALELLRRACEGK